MKRHQSRSFLLSVTAPIVVAILGIMVLWIKTDGARALTTETARRLAITRTPRVPVPVMLEASDRNRFTLANLNGHIVIVDFIYTNCPTLCVSLGATFTLLQMKLVEAGRNDVRLVSIGFDTERDTPHALAAYGERHHADPRWWTLARVANPQDLPSLLSSFGIVVIADSYGGFTHNAALHVIDSQGRLVRILDADDVVSAIAFLSAKSAP
ncbi:MAG: SCO family protein [Pseudorhodoplanes sp.]|nr:SCO family protein [Pseudorhodoplanes sp.]